MGLFSLTPLCKVLCRDSRWDIRIPGERRKADSEWAARIFYENFQKTGTENWKIRSSPASISQALRTHRPGTVSTDISGVSLGRGTSHFFQYRNYIFSIMTCFDSAASSGECFPSARGHAETPRMEEPWPPRCGGAAMALFSPHRDIGRRSRRNDLHTNRTARLIPGDGSAVPGSAARLRR